MKDKKSQLYLLLSAFFIGNALLAELTGVKIFSLGKVLEDLLGGLTDRHFQIIPMNMSIGVIIWPLVFITSDILNEYFGREGVRKISFITAGLIAYASLFLLTANKLPAADFWLENNRMIAPGGSFDINFAYNAVFRQGINIILGSLTAFLASQLIDAYTFQYLKKITGHRFLWLRATGSTVISQLVDSFVILYVAFYLLGNWSLEQVFQVGLLQYVYKVSLAVVLTPLIYLMHYFIDKYLEKGS
jgi:queuosine precursor transporter